MIGSYKIWKKNQPLTAIFDITHDNMSPFELFPNNSAILPLLASISFWNTPNWSNRGID